MGEAFNPYYKWLGIRPEEQPPHHYRLLGISVFEPDPDVIEAAADQRMAHLRGYQTGRHAELSQQLLNEVAAARICLLNPSKRAAYDEQLKLAMPVNSTTPTASQSSGPTFSVSDEEWSPRITRPKAVRPGRHKLSSNMGRIIGVALAVALAAIALLAWQIAWRQKPSVAAPPGVKPAAPRPKRVERPVDSLPPAPQKEHRGPATNAE
jgi:hypothetical protein